MTDRFFGSLLRQLSIISFIALEYLYFPPASLRQLT